MVCGEEPKSEKRFEVLALGTFLVSLFIFIYTLAPSVSTIFDDSLELQVVCYQLGIAHPTGYPLYTLLGKMFTLLLPVGDAAYRTNLLSAGCGALAVALVSLIVAKISGRRLAGFAGGLALAISPVFWSQATITEVYTLNSVFVALTIYLALLWQENESKLGASLSQKHKWLWLMALAFGFSLTHHRSVILLIPALVVFALLVNHRILHDRAALVGLLACVVLPQVLYAYIPLRGLYLSSLDGSYHNTLGGFLRYVSGLGYNVFLADNPLGQSRTLVDYVRLFYQQFGAAGLILGMVGFLYILLRWRKAFVLTALAFVAYTAFGFLYRVADIQVFFIPSFLFISIWLGLGLALLMEFIVRLVSVLILRPSSAAEVTIAPGSQPREVWRPSSELIGNMLALVVPVAFLVVLWPVGQARYPYVDRSRDWTVYDYGQDILGQPLERQAVIVGIQGEMTLLRYFQQAEDLRSDIVTIAADDERVRYKVVADNLEQGRPVYLTRPLSGIGNTYDLSAIGPLIQVQKRPSKVDVTPDFTTNAYLTNAIHLLGYDLSYLEQHWRMAVRLTLFWEAAASIPASYKVSARVYDEAGDLVGQTDAFPVHDTYPTISWDPGEVVRDVYDIPIAPGTPPGRCKMLLVLYRPEDAHEVGRVDLGNVVVKGSLDEPPVSELKVDHVAPLKVLDGVQLLGYNLPSNIVFEQGDRVPITLLWRLSDGAGKKRAFRTWLDKAEAWQVLPIPDLPTPDSDKPVGLVLLRQWVSFPLTARVPDGTYSLYLAGYTTEAEAQAGRREGILLGTVTVQGRQRIYDVPEMDTQVGAILDRRVTLLGFDLEDDRRRRPGDKLHVTLYWRARTEMDTSYTVFVHLVGTDGTIRAQQDNVPHHGEWPTTGWVKSEVIGDQYELTISPETPPGTYRLIAGMYKAETGQRLTATAGNDTPLGDFVPLTEIDVR